MTIRVLASFREPSGTTNPYITQLYRALREVPGLTVSSFSWRAALTQHWDVFHAHWPETTFVSRSWFRRLGKQVLFAFLLLKMRVARTAVVWTLHNTQAHERGDVIQRWLLRRLTRATTHVILLNSDTPVPNDLPSTLIPHGHYVDWYGRLPASRAIPGRIASFGLIRPYKGMENLLEAFHSWDETDVSLAIGGQPVDLETSERLVGLAASDTRIRLTLHFLDEAELVTLVTESELMVFPYLAMHNSGAVLAALSLGRPVLVPANEVNDRFANEVGELWVQRFQGRLTADVLAHALAVARTIPDGGSPDLAARDWRTVGEQHERAYQAAVARRLAG